MARTIPLDLDWARHGYLMLPNGRCRHVIGLDAIAADLIRAGAEVSWADLPGRHPAYCHVASRSILLAPWLFWSHPAYLRWILTHELAHLAVGHDEERARVWAQGRYEALLVSV